MSEKSEKCVVVGGNFVEPCATLEECVNNSAPSFSTRKGVAVWNLCRHEGGKLAPSRTFVGLICSAHPNGIAFNHCPFCGEDISAPFFTEADEDAA
jgi:hypothetical protein